MTQVEPGDCTISVHYSSPADQVGKLRIEHADPVIWIANELMDSMLLGEHHPDVELSGDLLTIRASNRTVVYRIAEYDPQHQRYLCHWPD